MPVNWIEYKGKKILYADFRGIRSQVDMVKNLEEQVRIIRTSAGRTNYFSNFSDSVVDNDFMNKAKNFELVFKEKVDRQAYVGIKGFKKLLVNTNNFFAGTTVKVFETEEEAKEYLVSDR